MNHLFSLLSRMLIILSLFFSFNATGYAQLITPEEYFGFQPGADRELFNYQPLIDYLQKLDEASPRIKMAEIGRSPMGKKMYAVFLSSEENIRNLEELKMINKELALNAGLSEESVAELVNKGKVFILATLSMHSTEVGPSQAAPLVAYEVATTTDPALLQWLDDVVYMMVPSHNPDGMDMVVDHYNQSKGTKYEGGNLPVVYNKYVGHDNNRDFITLTQSDTKAIARIYNKTWFPQVMVEKHQMWSTGPRYFVPPMHDPIAVNIDEKIWNWTWVFGSNMAKDMARDGCAGVSQHYLFDDYWPGSTETALWKNVIGLLTECASVQYAKPIYIEKNELKVVGKGLGEYKKSINMPMPWEGGWWRLGDIVKYELASTWSLIKTGSIHRKDILLSRNVLCKGEVAKGRNSAPYFYIFPAHQHDEGELTDMLALLDEQGVDVYKTNKKLEIGGKVVEQGDYVIPLAQPFRAFIKEVLEVQKFPERHYTPGGKLIKPYDITSWSLPLHRGLKSIVVNEKGTGLEKSIDKVTFPITKIAALSENTKALIFPARNNESYKMAFMAMQIGIRVKRATSTMKIDGVEVNPGDFILPVTKKEFGNLKKLFVSSIMNPIQLSSEIKEGVVELKMPSVALIETNFHDMDAGWTRFLFDSYAVPFTIVKPGEVVEKDLSGFDVIIFPDNDKTVLLEGKYKGRNNTYNLPSMDPRYTKGITKEGVQKLMKFVDEGGTIVSWGRSVGLFFGAQSIKISEKEKEEFQLPVRDISEDLKKQKFYCPGSLLNIELKEGHPLTYGMQPGAKVFTRGRPVFSTSVPYFDMDRRVIAVYPESNILASGYVENEKLLSGKPAMVWAKKGEGQFVFFGFYPQFRASTPGTYKLLFNSLMIN